MSDIIAVLERRARELAQRPAQAASTGAPLVLFRRANRLIGLDPAEVDGAGRLKAIAPVPGGPAWLSGAVQHQGTVLSLVDLQQFWGLQHTGVTDLPSFVVLSNGRAKVGLLAEELLGLEDTDGPVGPAAGERHAGLAGIARRRGQPVYAISARTFFEDPRLRP